MSEDNRHQSNQEDPTQEAPTTAIPEAVKDSNSYLKYIALKKSPVLQHPNRLIYTPNPNIVIDPQAHIAKINKEIQELGVDDRDEIQRQVRAYKVVSGRVRALRDKAYGIKKKSHHPSLMMPLLDERKSELLEYFGRMLDDNEVHKIVSLEWGYDVSVVTVRNFRRAHLSEITKLQDEFMKDFSSIRLSHKRARIEELQKLYNSRSAIYERSQSQNDYRLLLMTMKELREETRDDTLRIEHNLNANINLKINNHIEKEIMNGMTINDIIIARASSKMNVNPAFLIARLHQSIYAKFNGFVKPDGEAPTYPSSMVYNWTQIEKQHKDVGDKGIQDAEWEEVPEEKVEQTKDLQAILLEKIAQKKRDANHSQDRVNKNIQ